MSQSLSKLYIHAIFHVKYNEYLIRPEDDEELYTYIGGVINLSKSIPVIINGIENHIENQKTHHQKQSFHDEYIQFLKDHDVDYDEKFLWS